MRKPRVHYQGGLYHVIARGNQRQKVFLGKEDYLKYLRLMDEYLEHHGMAVYAYCLMPNHVHILLEQAADQPLSRYMQRLQSAYTGYFNRKHKKVGHLFQGRYKAILVDRDAYLLELIRYVHLNPIRAKLEEKVGAYPWSGHAQYLGTAKENTVRIETAKVLHMFGKTEQEARKAYQKFVWEGIAQGHREDLYDVRRGHLLGDEDFETHVHEKVLKQKVTPSLKLKLEISQIWKKIKERERLAEEPLGWKRSRWIGEAAYLAVEGCGKKQKEVAEYFEVEPTTVNKALRRLRKRWEERPNEEKEFMRWVKSL
jgi:REP element-mobilizing transposase RayT/DNA-binding transcriptional regulator YhcF (GntR family)